ncbi:MAG: hypothetical protein HY243_03200 [Proteobacteria bacterium]|nr:hypothetical protein [Pseudomonadota bacterium]
MKDRSTARQERLAAALRENLKRRKARARSSEKQALAKVSAKSPPEIDLAAEERSSCGRNPAPKKS